MSRSKILAFSLLPVLIAANVTRSSGQKNDADELIKVDSDMVVLRATVSDRNGKAILGLNKVNFHLSEDGVEQKIEFFSADPLPVSWILVLDRSGSMFTMMRDVYDAALHVIDDGTSLDEMAITTFNGRVELTSSFERDKHRLQNAILGLRADGNTALYDAVSFSLDRFREANNRKKVMVVVTDGEDNASKLPFRSVVERAEEEDVTIYTVGMFGGMSSKDELRFEDDLEKLAASTGGRSHFPRNVQECEQAMYQIALEVRQQYSLAYYPTNTSFDGKWRQIQLTVEPSNTKEKRSVRTRPGYYAKKKILAQ